MKFYIYLDNGEVYPMVIDCNLQKYKIFKGNLYRGSKLLGKIIKVKEEMDDEQS